MWWYCAAQGFDGAYSGYGDGVLDHAAYGLTPPRLGESLTESSETAFVPPGSRIAALPDCGCPAAVEYVCGSDGNTYDNACMATCAGVTPVIQGICTRGCVCCSDFDPWCLVPEQTTFYNVCVHACTVSSEDPRYPFDRAGACTGQCLHCPSTVELVCHTPTGHEFINACYAECTGVFDWTPGSCDPLCVDTCLNEGDHYGNGVYDFDVQVCGKDGITYQDGCLAYCSIGTAYTGPCEDNCELCDHQGGPEVCGVDGNTYINACSARCAPVDIRTEAGPCPEGCACSAEVLEVVCGSSGNSFLNRCFAECARDVVMYEGLCDYITDDYVPEIDGFGNPISFVGGVAVVENSTDSDGSTHVAACPDGAAATAAML